MTIPRDAARVTGVLGLLLVFCAFTTLPFDPVETCKAIDFDGSLVCEGTCNGDPAPTCREITHSIGITFCGCQESEALPGCCELAKFNGAVATTGNCQGQGCATSGYCDKKTRALPYHWEAFCNPNPPPE